MITFKSSLKSLLFKGTLYCVALAKRLLVVLLWREAWVHLGSLEGRVVTKVLINCAGD